MKKFFLRRYAKFMLFIHPKVWICRKHLVEKQWHQIGDKMFGYVCEQCHDDKKAAELMSRSVENEYNYYRRLIARCQ